MEHETVGRVPLLISLFKGTHDQIDIRLPGNVPGDDFPGKQVDNNAEIVPFAAGFDIREITDPDVSDFVSAKPLIIVSINMEDRRLYLLVFKSPGSRFGAKMLVVCAPIYLQDPA